MADDSKKTSYTTWILIIAAVVLVLVLAVLFYLIWKKLGTMDLRLSEKNKAVEDTRTQVVRLESESKARDDRVQELSKEMSALRESNTKLNYKMKELRNKSPSEPQVVIGSKAKKPVCNDASCNMGTDDA